MMVGTQEEIVSSLIDHIYQCVDRPELWPDTIREIGQIIGARSSFWSPGPISLQPSLDPAFSEAGSPGMLLSRADLRRIEQSAAECEELIAKFLKLVFVSILWSQEELAPREAIGLRMVRRYLRKYDSPVERSRFLAALWEDGLVFGQSDIRIMKLLAPHLDRAVRFGSRLNLEGLHAKLLSGVLDQLTLGVILLDTVGKPLWLNRRAQELSELTHALKVAPIGLVGRDPNSTQLIRDAIGQARRSGQPAVATLARDDVSRPLLLTAIQLEECDDGLSFGSAQQAHSVVFVSDPDTTVRSGVKSLQSAFKLTAREAELAIIVAQGGGLKLAAAALGVAQTTARSHLQQVFAKTGTNHQAELAALVHRTLAYVAAV